VTPLNLDEALLALSGAAGAVATAPSARAIVARHADFWRFRVAAPPDVRPWQAVYPVAALSPNGRHLLAMLLDAATRAPSLEAIAVSAVQAQPALGVGGPFGGVARDFQRLLPAAELTAEPARREALLRAVARACGAAVQVGGAIESAKQSALVAERLDVRALKAQERAMRKQMRLMEAARSANVLIASGKDLGP
jgi:hypothetical protein